MPRKRRLIVVLLSEESNVDEGRDAACVRMPENRVARQTRPSGLREPFDRRLPTGFEAFSRRPARSNPPKVQHDPSAPSPFLRPPFVWLHCPPDGRRPISMRRPAVLHAQFGASRDGGRRTTQASRTQNDAATALINLRSCAVTAQFCVGEACAFLRPSFVWLHCRPDGRLPISMTLAEVVHAHFGASRYGGRRTTRAAQAQPDAATAE